LFSDSLVSLAEMETETLNVIELGARAWPGSNLELVLDWDPTLSSCLNVIELGIWSLCLIGIDHETWDLCLVVIYGKREVILCLVLKVQMKQHYFCSSIIIETPTKQSFPFCFVLSSSTII
jgi:hypothetical protein